jgi:hypothetical protein
LRRTRQFLALTVFGGESQGGFTLARYFDVDYERRGPAALAGFLGLRVEEVFPVAYDIGAVAVGLAEVIRGSIPSEPAEKLTEEELTALAVGRDRPAP